MKNTSCSCGKPDCPYPDKNKLIATLTEERDRLAGDVIRWRDAGLESVRLMEEEKRQLEAVNARCLAALAEVREILTQSEMQCNHPIDGADSCDGEDCTFCAVMISLDAGLRESTEPPPSPAAPAIASTAPSSTGQTKKACR